MQKISPFLWFDNQAEEAANLYVSTFKNSRILSASPMVCSFELEGQPFLALNGGPQYRFSEAVSFMIHCESQEEIDWFWDKLSEGGEVQRCGWLKDRFGLSWQVVPTILGTLIGDPDPEKSSRAMQAMFQMTKLDIEALKRAHAGEPS
ncbi:MAG TPA: VOC family protein [Fimbriimonadaceae bacterium]|nr:VOC family protein [Fimbriimonadaceae bacterium]